MKQKEKEREEALQHLRDILKPGDEVRTILRHVSRSGMLRSISPIFKDNDLSYWFSKALDWPLHKTGGVSVGGCGMDMGFHLVYTLSRCLWREGFDCIGKDCPSNDHFNREEKKHHSDGGYGLRQRWL